MDTLAGPSLASSLKSSRDTAACGGALTTIIDNADRCGKFVADGNRVNYF